MVEIIAEAGVNHNGDLSTALRMVEAAKRVGANAVKFQVYDADLLTSDSAEKAMLEKYEFNALAWCEIADHCEQVGIEFLGTPFDLPSVDLLERLGVKRYKVASPDIVNLPLLAHIANKRKPVLLSTGVATEVEIKTAIDVLIGGMWAERISLLHCVSEYPCPLNRINLARIPILRNRFRMCIGLSDHTIKIETGMMAVVAGATVLEKHFTLDNLAVGPDHKMSLMPEGLKQYIDMARLAEQAMGVGWQGITSGELRLRYKTRRSLYALCDMGQGEPITARNSIALRPQVEGAHTPVALYIGAARATQGAKRGEAIR